MLMATELGGNLPRICDVVPRELTEPVTRWCMVIVAPGREQVARDCLRRHGIGAYWPNYSEHRVVRQGNQFRPPRRSHRPMLSAVIPGVLLSPAKFSDLFWNVLDLAPGVINIARDRETAPLVLDETDIVIIHKIEQGLNIPPPSKPRHNFKVGQKVRFCDDDLSRWGLGKVAQLLQDGRIGVDIPLMGRVTRVVVLPHQIARS